MKTSKIYILGSTGSGKTTLANKISKITNLTHYGLDWIVYKDHHAWKTKYSEKTRDKKLHELLKKKKWIIEGGYAEDWILPIIKKAEFVIILQLSRKVLMKRIFKRYIKNKLNKKGDNLIDMLNLLKFSYKYKKNSFLTHKKMAEEHKRKYIILRSNKEVKKFLEELR